MTPKQADKLIRSGKPVTVYNKRYGIDHVFTTTFIRRDRWNVYTVNGGCFDRGELELAPIMK